MNIYEKMNTNYFVYAKNTVLLYPENSINIQLCFFVPGFK